jgi:hypothetical protein
LEGHALNRLRAPLALTVILSIVPAGWTIGAPLAAAPAGAQASGKDDATKELPPSKPAVDRPATVEGKTIDGWLAALKDRDPAARKRAVEVLGERSVDPAIPQDERSRLHTAVASLALSEKDREVWRAAAFFTDLFKVSGFPGEVKRLRDERRRAIDPTRIPIRLVDAQGRPVQGAIASTYFQRFADYESTFSPPDVTESATSDAQGDLRLKIEIPGHLNGQAIYAIKQGRGRPLVGLHKVTREELGQPITIVMRPACRVLFRIDSRGLPALEEKYHAELASPGWWRAAYVLLGGGINNNPRPLFASSTTGEFEFLLPPGRFIVHAYGEDVRSIERPLEVGPDDRELLLGTYDVPPSLEAQQGKFPEHYRVRQKDADGGAEVAFRRIRFLPLRWMSGEARDVAFSPDGKLLATAHSYNADPGEVKLWDMTTGARIASLPLADRGVVSVAFSPDGRLVAGRVYAMADPRSSWAIVLWDAASRREVRTFGGPAEQISVLAFSPDGKVITTCGADRATRFWDVASGRETRRVDGAGSGWALALAPDHQTLVMTGAGRALTLWDVAGNRLRVTLEPESERFAVQSVAFAPDGRTLAAAGTTLDAKGAERQGQVRLYDLAREPISRRAVLTFDGAWFGLARPNDQVTPCSDVAFTPDGRRVVAVAEHKIRIWDAATGAELVAYDERGGSGSSDRLAVSPDGRWLAITRPGHVAVQDISPPGP